MTRSAVLITVLAASVVAAQAQSSAAKPASSGVPQAGTANTGRPPIQTKTREEYKAYQAAAANTQDPEAMEKAADDFAAKFPNSDVRVLLYRAAMSEYQNAGNPEKMMNMGLKVLAIDKDDPEALIGIAEILEERTGPTDLDREQRSEQVVEYASHALKTLDTDLAVPAGLLRTGLTHTRNICARPGWQSLGPCITSRSILPKLKPSCVMPWRPTRRILIP